MLFLLFSLLYIHQYCGYEQPRYICNRGVPPLGGSVGERGIFIIPYSECFQGFLVKPNDELVWDLGQTCEAARNGTIFFIDKNPLTIYTVINFIFKIVVGFENTEKRRNFNDRSSFFLFMQKKILSFCFIFLSTQFFYIN